MIKFKLREQLSDREFREERRITLTEVAEQTGIGRITLSRMLKPGAVIRTDILNRLCDYFECRIEELLEYVPDGAARSSQPAAKGD